MTIELRSPQYDRESMDIPREVSILSRPFNGTICSGRGDEYQITNNILNLIEDTGELSLAQSSNHWKITASFYEDLWRKRSLSILSGEEFPVEKEKELLLKWFPPKAGEVYLDVGCSTALYARMLKKAEPGSDVLALDLSFQMLEEARMKAEAENADIYFLRADARQMPFFRNSLDGLVMGGTLNELTDELKVLFECRRVLREKGRFFMMHLIKSPTWYGKLFQESTDWSGIRFWTLDESNDLFNKAGFTVQDQFVSGIVCFSLLLPS